MGPRFTEQELRAAVAESRTWAETLRRLGYRSGGGNWRTLKKYAPMWGISTDHFDPTAVVAESLARVNKPKPLEEVLVRGSSYHRGHLKRRLFQEGVKERRCELCGQGEVWRGERMALILDHINGCPDDHRLHNLRILCPNCAATLSTHCARKNRRPLEPRDCLRCQRPFYPKYHRQRYCSRECGSRWDRARFRGVPKPEYRRVERPPFAQLIAEIDEMGYLAVGRKYGVSDNAIRKWVRQYEREQELRFAKQPSEQERTGPSPESLQLALAEAA